METTFPSEYCPGGHVKGGTSHTVTPALMYDSLSITVTRFGEGSPLQMIFITLVSNGMYRHVHLDHAVWSAADL